MIRGYGLAFCRRFHLMAWYVFLTGAAYALDDSWNENIELGNLFFSLILGGPLRVRQLGGHRVDVPRAGAALDAPACEPSGFRSERISFPSSQEATPPKPPFSDCEAGLAAGYGAPDRKRTPLGVSAGQRHRQPTRRYMR